MVMSQFVYIVHLREFINTGENIFKIGRTKDGVNRMSNYPKGSKIILLLPCSNFVECENEIIKLFTHKYIHMIVYGREYFKGDLKDMIATMISIMQDKYFNLSLTKISEKDVDIYEPPDISNILEFNKPNCDYIIDDFILEIYNKPGLESIGLCKIIKHLYFNPEHPENHCFHIKNMKSKEIWVAEEKQWVSGYYKDMITHMLDIPICYSNSIVLKKLTEIKDEDQQIHKGQQLCTMFRIIKKPSKTVKEAIYKMLCDNV